VNVVRYKTLAFTISSAGTGLAGALFVHFLQLASPEIGLILQTGLVICMVVIGGMGTATGPLIGALLVEYASEVLRGVGVRHLLVFSAAVIIVARFFREGLMGVLPRLARRPTPAGSPAQHPAGVSPHRGSVSPHTGSASAKPRGAETQTRSAGTNPRSAGTNPRSAE
jgi:branched-chain amino acid transport system permease protein